MCIAYIAKHPDGKRFLCIQEGAGTGYYPIEQFSLVIMERYLDKLKPITKDFKVGDVDKKKT